AQGAGRRRHGASPGRVDAPGPAARRRGQRRPGRRFRPLAQGPAVPIRARPGRRAGAAVPARRRRGRCRRHGRRPDAGVTRMDEKLSLPGGSTGDGTFSLLVTPERAGWAYCGLRVLNLPPGAAHTWATGEDELLILPLAGSGQVTCDGETFA